MSDIRIEMIRNTRIRLGEPPRVFGKKESGYLSIKPPAWLNSSDDDLSVVYQDHGLLLTHGTVVWGALVMANQAMFEPGYLEQVVNNCSGVSYTYKDYVEKVANLAEMDGPAIGDRAPEVDFETGGTLWDHSRHPFFTLLVMPGGGDLNPTVKQLEERFGAVMRVAAPSKSDALSIRYGKSDGQLYLVRPDGYVGFKCKAGEAGLLEAYLSNTLKL